MKRIFYLVLGAALVVAVPFVYAQVNVGGPDGIFEQVASSVNATDGSVGAPSIHFASDTDTGFYRIGANNIGLAVGGACVADISSSGWVSGIPIDVDGYNIILDTDGDSAIINDRSSSPAISDDEVCYAFNGLTSCDYLFTDSGLTCSDPVHVIDDVVASFGNTVSAPDIWCEHDTSSSPDRFVCWTTDADGGGTDGVLYYVSDGTDDVRFSGNIQLGGTTILSAPADGELRFTNAAGTSADMKLWFGNGGAGDARINWTTATSLFALSTGPGGNVSLYTGGYMAAPQLRFSPTTGTFIDAPADGALCINQNGGNDACFLVSGDSTLLMTQGNGSTSTGTKFYAEQHFVWNGSAARGGLLVNTDSLVMYSYGGAASAIRGNKDFAITADIDDAFASSDGSDADYGILFPTTGLKGVNLVDISTDGFALLTLTQKDANQELTASSGTQYGLQITPEIAQSGTAAYKAIAVNVADTSSGSGQDYMAYMSWDGDEKFSVKDTGEAAIPSGQNYGFESLGGYGAVTKSFAYSDMVDGGGAVGTISFDDAIPDGAIVQRSLCHSLTGFTGDVSATITIGDGTDVDRYNTGTPSVFTTNASGVDLGVVSGTAWHDDTKTPVVTITTNADFTSVSAGQLTCAVFYWSP